MSLQDKAREMYQTHTAKAIAVELGVSESSVRRWVKGVEKERVKQYSSIVESILSLAIRPQGIRNKEEWNLYKEVFGYSVDEETGAKKVMITDSQKSYIRSMVKEEAIEQGGVATFVPDWLSPSEPRASWDAMLSMTNEMYERMQEYINGYLWEFDMPIDARHAVTQQLLVLLVPEYSPRGIYDVCKQATDVVDRLERNKQVVDKKPQTLPTSVSAVFESVDDIRDSIY